VCATNLALAKGILDGFPAGEEHYEPHLDSQPGYCCVVFTPEATG
jgi:hypothetical protein